jgi:hypothetical protein
MILKDLAPELDINNSHIDSKKSLGSAISAGKPENCGRKEGLHRLFNYNQVKTKPYLAWWRLPVKC